MQAGTAKSAKSTKNVQHDNTTHWNGSSGPCRGCEQSVQAQRGPAGGHQPAPARTIGGWHRSVCGGTVRGRPRRDPAQPVGQTHPRTPAEHTAMDGGRGCKALQAVGCGRAGCAAAGADPAERSRFGVRCVHGSACDAFTVRRAMRSRFGVRCAGPATTRSPSAALRLGPSFHVSLRETSLSRAAPVRSPPARRPLSGARRRSGAAARRGRGGGSPRPTTRTPAAPTTRGTPARCDPPPSPLAHPPSPPSALPPSPLAHPPIAHSPPQPLKLTLTSQLPVQPHYPSAPFHLPHLQPTASVPHFPCCCWCGC